MKKESTYLQYGVSSELSNKIVSLGLSLDAFKDIPKKELVGRYGLDPEEVDQVKNCIVRKPIDEDILNSLLYNNRFVCCLCKGSKSDSYIIHHIEEYSISQNNGYDNLAVLCPNDHELAHRMGQNLARKITPSSIRCSKKRWEEEVIRLNIFKTCNKGEVHEIDFCNIPRIYDLCLYAFDRIPEVENTAQLLGDNLILSSGIVNDEYLNRLYPQRLNTPLKFWSLGGAALLRYYFLNLFLKVIKQTKVEYLDDLLFKKVIKSRELEGIMCLYVGGLYGKKPKEPITPETKPINLYFRKNHYFVEWLFDPQFLTSSTSISRLGKKRSILFMVKLGLLERKKWKGEVFTHLDIRPYIFGVPQYHLNRTPDVFYDKQQNEDVQDFFDENNL